MKYSPAIISGLFLDDVDFSGIIYWFNLINEINKLK